MLFPGLNSCYFHCWLPQVKFLQAICLPYFIHSSVQMPLPSYHLPSSLQQREECSPLCSVYKWLYTILSLPLWLSWWRICLQCRRCGFNPWVGKIPWGRERLPTPVFWPGESHGQYSPWGHKKHNWATFTHSQSLATSPAAHSSFHIIPIDVQILFCANILPRTFTLTTR